MYVTNSTNNQFYLYIIFPGGKPGKRGKTNKYKEKWQKKGFGKMGFCLAFVAKSDRHHAPSL